MRAKIVPHRTHLSTVVMLSLLAPTKSTNRGHQRQATATIQMKGTTHHVIEVSHETVAKKNPKKEREI